MGDDTFKFSSLEEVVSIHDTDRVPIKKSDRKVGPYPYYGASGITDFVEGFRFDGDYLLLAEDGDNLRTRNTPIAFMARGKFWVNNHAHVLKGKNGNDTDYLCYALQIADVTSYISGSTRPKITQKDLRRIPVICAPLHEQKAIAHILGTLDDKIELNRKMNGTLESMAQAMFKSWFVDFDPVIDNALAAGNPIPEPLQTKAQTRKERGDQKKSLPPDIQKLFPDAFYFDEEMGWIPKGWAIGSLADIAALTTQSVQPNKEPQTEWQHFSIPAFDESQTPVWDLGQTIKSGKYRVPASAILASKLNPQFPRVWRPAVKDEVVSVCSTEFMPFVPHAQNQRTFLYSLFCSTVIQTEIANRVTGSTGSRQRVKPNEIAEMPVMVPSSDLRDNFSEIVSPWLISIEKAKESQRVLSKLRDTLLPKLLSGELRIPDAEKLVEGLT